MFLLTDACIHKEELVYFLQDVDEIISTIPSEEAIANHSDLVLAFLEAHIQ